MALRDIPVSLLILVIGTIFWLFVLEKIQGDGDKEFLESSKDKNEQKSYSKRNK